MINRRRFLKTTAGSAMLGCFPATLDGMARQAQTGQIEKRALGKTGEHLSIIGLGGVVVMDVTATQASGYVGKAIDMGINYFDVAPTYGNAEDMLGPALEPYRKGVFLACKTQARTKAEAQAEMETSLKKLRTDHFDLYQMHAVTKIEDAKTILGPGGALEAFLEAQKAGKTRFIGFTAHSVEAAQILLDGFDFDTILFPINYGTWNAGNFGPQVLEKAQEKGMGILALKAMAKGPLPERGQRIRKKCWYEPLVDEKDASQALRFTLSHPVTAAVPPGDEQLFEMAMKLALGFEPLSQGETLALKEKALSEKPLFTYPSENA